MTASTPKPPSDAQTLFRRQFNYPPAHIVRAPGCLTLLGGLSAGHEGLALAAAINRGVQIASSPRTDGKFELISEAAPGSESFWANDLGPNPATPWAAPVKAVLARLRERGVHFKGFSAAISTDIPANVTAGRDAALAVAVALTVRLLHPFSLTETGLADAPRPTAKGELPPLTHGEKLALARFCASAPGAETRRPPPLAETLTSLFGKAWRLVGIDFRFLTVEQIPLIGEAFVLCDSRDPATTHPHDREIAAKLGVKALRSMELKSLAASRDRLTEPEFLYARHIIAEIQRVVAAERALIEEDHRQFGQFLFQSCESLRTLPGTETPELDLLIGLARESPACLGVCAAGNSTVNLVPLHQAPAFMSALAERFRSLAGRELYPMLCRTADAAGIVRPGSE